MQDNSVNQNLDLLSIGEASEYLGISIDTLRRWEKKGRIVPLRSPGGHRYFSKSALEDLFGKRYTRDEETQRASSQKDSTVAIKSTENQFPSGIVDEASITSFTEKSSVTSEPLTSRYQPPTLPSWRSLKEENTEVVLNSTPLIRHVREIKIPEARSIRIVTEKRQAVTSTTVKEVILSPSTSESYIREQSSSILTPSIDMTQSAHQASLDTSKELSSRETLHSDSNVSKQLKVNQNTKKYIAFSLVIIAFILASIAWYFAWQKSQIVLSPVP